MRKIVLDTNCLLMSLPRISPYRKIWDDFLKGKLTLCVTNEIIEEYLEIIEQKTNANIASNVVSVILSQKNVEFVTPYYKLHLIQADEDDNKFVDCACSWRSLTLARSCPFFTGVPSSKLISITFPEVSKDKSTSSSGRSTPVVVYSSVNS